MILRFENVKKELSKISKIEDITLRLKKYDELTYLVNEKAKIKRVKTGNYFYFYPIIKYSNRGNPKLDASIGRISIRNFELHKGIIEKLRNEGNIEELQKYLDQY